MLSTRLFLVLAVLVPTGLAQGVKPEHRVAQVVQDLQAQMKALKAENAALTRRLAASERRSQRLEVMLEQMNQALAARERAAPPGVGDELVRALARIEAQVERFGMQLDGRVAEMGSRLLDQAREHAAMLERRLESALGRARPPSARNPARRGEPAAEANPEAKPAAEHVPNPEWTRLQEALQRSVEQLDQVRARHGGQSEEFERLEQRVAELHARLDRTPPFMARRPPTSRPARSPKQRLEELRTRFEGLKARETETAAYLAKVRAELARTPQYIGEGQLNPSWSETRQEIERAEQRLAMMPAEVAALTAEIAALERQLARDRNRRRR